MVGRSASLPGTQFIPVIYLADVGMGVPDRAKSHRLFKGLAVKCFTAETQGRKGK